MSRCSRGDSRKLTGFFYSLLFSLFALFVLSLIVRPGFGIAQESENEVHISPRAAPKKDIPPSPAEGFPDDATVAEHKPIRVNVDLVLIPVTVTDPLNRLVTGLEKENFSLMEGNAPQTIKYFSSEDEPISVGLIFDVSGSMSNKILKSRDAAVEFFKTANPQDEFFVIAFNDRPELIQDFTNSVEDIQGKLVYAVPKGRTAMLDAIYLGINKMRNAKYDKKALLIISDGGDNSSRYTENEIKSRVKEADVQIYSIGLFEANAPTIEEANGPALLDEISGATGGRMFRIADPGELADVATKIGIELRNQYVLGYRPTNAVRDGKWRKVKVKLAPPKGLPILSVHAKTGYYAPSG